MRLLPYILGVSDTLLLLVLLVLLVRGGAFNRYATFAIYIFSQAATDLAEWLAYSKLGSGSPAYRTLYWTDQVALNLLLFLVVIAFAYEALRDSPLRPKAAKVFAIVIGFAILLPLALLHNQADMHRSFTDDWFNRASQIWNFGAAIMNLVLWAALLSNRRRDPQLVTLSIGVGLATASAAIAWGVRLWLAKSNRWPVDSFMIVAHITSLLLWCWAFRPSVASHPPPPAKPSKGASRNALSKDVVTPS